LVFEYNLFMMERTVIKSTEKLPTGKVTVEIETTRDGAGINAPLDIVMRANGKVVGKGRVPMSASIFTANECLDIGQDLGSPVASAYYDRAPFAFNGQVLKTVVSYPQK
jgi:arylsulfatase